MNGDLLRNAGDRAVIGGVSVLVQITLVAGVALLVSSQLKRRAAARYWVLCWAVGLMLISPFVALMAPASTWSVASRQLRATSAVAEIVEETIAKPQAASAANYVGDAAAEDSMEFAAPASTGIADSSTAIERSGEAKSAGDMGRSALSMLMLVWTLGAAVLLTRAGVGWWRLARLLRSALPCRNVRVDAALEEACRLLGLKQAQRVLCSPKVQGPLAAGLRRSCIVLPVGLADRVSHGELRDILVHELAHLQRRDPAIVLLQNVAAAAFWVHPLVRSVNVRLAQAREEICDNYVLATTDAPGYSRTLLRLTELIPPAQPWAGAAGLLTSRWTLESRVAGILDADRSLRTRLTRFEAWQVAVALLAACVMAGVAGVALAVAKEGQSEADAPLIKASKERAKLAGDDLAKPWEQASHAAAKSRDAVETAHIKFWLTRGAGGFKADVTPERLTDLLATHDLVRHPESLRDVMAAILEAPVKSPTPWSEMEVHVRNDDAIRSTYIRETRHRPDGDPDVHLVGPEVSLRWADANSQMDVDRSRDNRISVTNLNDFWAEMRAPRELAEPVIESNTIDGRPVLTVTIKLGANGVQTLVIDQATGFLLSDDSIRGTEHQLSRWLGWTDSPSDVRFPSVVVSARFNDSKLQTTSFHVVRQARFNMPLADTVFKLGAPAGAVIVDRRRPDPLVRRINRDVFDAASDAEVTNAANPYDLPITPAERDAFAELHRIYVLGDDETVRRIAPPFPLSRKYLHRMLNPSFAESRRLERFNFLEWRDEKLSREFALDGITPKVSHLIGYLVKHPLTDVDIPKAILDHELPGDFIFRAGASQDELVAAVSAILSEDLGRKVRLEFKNVERKVYVARGELTLDDARIRKREGRPLLAMNGGEHAGDHGEAIGFGNSADLLRDLSDYVGVKIVDESKPSEQRLSWSKRWYDLPQTPSGERFQLEPNVVLKQVQEQTRIEFAEEMQAVRVLTLVGE